MVRAGTVLAERYRLEQRVGSGGMGEVWRAVDLVLGRTVAVKCLLGGLPDEPVFVDRFRAEARIMATISHPGVVEVHDFGADPAVGVYLVMKYIEGESLAQTLARVGRLSPEATMRLVASAAEALHAAHEKGVTHRDVKPGNLLLRPDGGVLVTDFGIARSAGASAQTATGSLVGTAGYIAPERALGRPATPASDVYALGIVAYRCLAGRLPFAGDSVVEIAMRHVHDEPPPLPPDVPAGVRAIVERAMAKDPAMRWPSGAVLADQARRALAQGPHQHQHRPAAAVIPPEVASATTRPQAVVPVPPPGSMPVPTRSQPARDRHRGGRLLAVVGAGLAVAAVAAVGILLNLPADAQPQSLAASPGAGTPSPAGAGGAVIPVASVGATNPAASPSPAGALPSSAATTSPKASAPTTALAAPGNLTATPISAGTIRLRWKDRSVGESGFTVIDGSTSRDVGPDTTTYDWTGLAPSSYSCFKVRAFNSSGVSAYYPAAQETWVCAISLSGAGPAAPGNLTATAIGTSTIRLQWSDNSSDEDGFTITNGNTSRNTGAGTTAYAWDGLAPGTYMCFKVRAFHSTGVSAYEPAAQSTWVCATTPTA
ncbi:serine/threonine-protein kinase [Allocatelliglobosispora scoriae]|uniref:non-specific serine/threonine protein kinase n=1 Tax=Allocatelliglobosispora scoriae TaxID=643052 RepID=A0A841C3J0_9ACTN|nr:protein kinase [Allocatelliglobosispora scoriae]MBB5873703.1 serine/threonine-protein kinase [Allocatelliglobosispora scoriae]